MKVKKHYLLAGFIILIVVLLKWEGSSNDAASTVSGHITQSENIAKRYCSSCHLFPAPELLDKETWRSGVLPDMGRRMGVQTEEYDPIKDVATEEVEIIQKLNIYPDSPMISVQDWNLIVEYYTTLAPDTLSAQQFPSQVSEEPPPFQVNMIDIEGKQVPQVTLLHYDSVNSDLYIGDNKYLYALNQNGIISSTWELTSPAVDLAFDQNNIRYLLNIGHFRPSDLELGSFSILGCALDLESSPILINDLPRPVSFSIGDLDNDDKEDVVVCGFGHHKGELSWFDDYKNKNVLSTLPGARKAIIRDMNDDHRPDIIALMAQAWEGVDIYYNQGQGEFKKERVIEFSPVYGVSYMEMVDFNGDGYEDLLITNGDNWDYSTIKKPYHGIRIYLNNGQNEFEEAFFYPMYGCNKAIARDFDGDGDMDIAAISFYDNIDQPEKSFVYLENTGDLTFSAHYMPEAVNGKWLTMEAGDFNQDGRIDLFLGSYFHNIDEWTKLLNKGITTFPEALLLLNIAKNQ